MDGMGSHWIGVMVYALHGRIDVVCIDGRVCTLGSSCSNIENSAIPNILL